MRFALALLHDCEFALHLLLRLRQIHALALLFWSFLVFVGVGGSEGGGGEVVQLVEADDAVLDDGDLVGVPGPGEGDCDLSELLANVLLEVEVAAAVAHAYVHASQLPKEPLRADPQHHRPLPFLHAHPHALLETPQLLADRRFEGRTPLQPPSYISQVLPEVLERAYAAQGQELLLVLHACELKKQVLLRGLPQALSEVLLVSRGPVVEPKVLEVAAQHLHAGVEAAQQSQDIGGLPSQLPELDVIVGELCLREDEALAFAGGDGLLEGEAVLLVEHLERLPLLHLRAVPADLGAVAQRQQVIPLALHPIRCFAHQRNRLHLHRRTRNRVRQRPWEETSGLLAESDDAELGEGVDGLAAGLLDVMVDVSSDAVAGGRLPHADVAEAVADVVVDVGEGGDGAEGDLGVEVLQHLREQLRLQVLQLQRPRVARVVGLFGHDDDRALGVEGRPSRAAHHLLHLDARVLLVAPHRPLVALRRLHHHQPRRQVDPHRQRARRAQHPHLQLQEQPLHHAAVLRGQAGVVEGQALGQQHLQRPVGHLPGRLHEGSELAVVLDELAVAHGGGDLLAGPLCAALCGAKDERALALRVQPHRLQQFEVERALEGEGVARRLEPQHHLSHLHWPVLLAEHAHARLGHPQPLGHLVNVGDGGADGHDAQGGVETHDPANDGLQSGAALLEVEHVDLVDEEEADAGEVVEVLAGEEVDLLGRAHSDVRAQVLLLPALAVPSHLGHPQPPSEPPLPRRELLVAETLDGGQVEAERGWRLQVLGDGQFEEDCFAGGGGGADDEVVVALHDERQAGLLDGVELCEVEEPLQLRVLLHRSQHTNDIPLQTAQLDPL